MVCVDFCRLCFLQPKLPKTKAQEKVGTHQQMPRVRRCVVRMSTIALRCEQELWLELRRLPQFKVRSDRRWFLKHCCPDYSPIGFVRGGGVGGAVTYRL